MIFSFRSSEKNYEHVELSFFNFHWTIIVHKPNLNFENLTAKFRNVDFSKCEISKWWNRNRKCVVERVVYQLCNVFSFPTKKKKFVDIYVVKVILSISRISSNNASLFSQAENNLMCRYNGLIMYQWKTSSLNSKRA